MLPLQRGGRLVKGLPPNVAVGLPKGWSYRVAIINEAFARQYLNGSNPLGRRVGLDDNRATPTPIEIVGLVKATNAWAIREDRRPQIFFLYLQASIENVSTYT